MRRSSIITIILLILIIIGLSVALVVTNLPTKEKTEEPVVAEEPAEEVTKEETPVELPIDGEVGQRAYSILTAGGYFSKGIYYNLKFGNIDTSKFTQQEMQTVVFILKYQEYKEPYVGTMIDGRVSRANMEKGMKEFFGDVSFAPTTCGPFNNVEYNSSDGYYYIHTGFGGGGPFGGKIHGISKIEEYSDRYVVTEKYAYVDTYQASVPSGHLSGYIYNIYDYDLKYNLLGTYKDDTLADRNYGAELTHEEFFKDLSGDKIYAGQQSDVESDTARILTQYYDQVSELKHTFMKSDDGSFYYLSTELTK